MTFTEILQHILAGKNVTRKEWNDKRHYAFMQDYILHIHKAGEAEDINHPWIICEADLVGDDWEVV